MVAALRRKHRIHVSPGTPEPVTSFDTMPQSVSNLEVSKLLMLMHAYAKIWQAATNLNLKEVAWGGIGDQRTLITNVWIVIFAYFCNKKLIIVGAETAETQTLITGTCAIFDFICTCRKYSKVPTENWGGVPIWLVRNLKSMGFSQPTPIQMQCFPAIMSGNHVLASAPTGRVWVRGPGKHLQGSACPYFFKQLVHTCSHITWNLNSDFLTLWISGLQVTGRGSPLFEAFKLQHSTLWKLVR